MSEDSELLRRFAANDSGSESAFAEFVARRIGFVYGAALRQTSGAGQAHLAGEITQAVFLAASKKAAALARHGNLTGWLYATTTLTARRMLRDARLRRVREQQAAAMNELLYNTNTTSAKSAGVDRMRETLDEALARLGEKDREIVLLRFFDGRDFAEIGALTGITGDTARMRVTRALDKMRALYARRGVASTAAALGAFMAAEAATAAPAGLAGSVSGAILAGGGAAAVTTTTTAGILAFMTSTKIAITATVAVLVTATVATVEMRRERAAADDLAALRREHTALLKKLGDTQTQVKGDQTKLTNLRRQNAEAAEASKNPNKLNPLFEALKALLAQHPEIQAMLLEQRKTELANMYYSAGKRLNLTPEQFAEIVELIDKSGQMAGPNRFIGNIPGFEGVIFLTGFVSPNQGDQEAYDKLKELVGGADGLKALTTGFGENTQSLAKNLYYTDTPLTADQMAHLDRLFRSQWKEGRLNWDAVRKQAGAFLSEPQMAALTQMSDLRVLQNDIYKMEDVARTEIAKQPVSNSGTEESQ